MARPSRNTEKPSGRGGQTEAVGNCCLEGVRFMNKMGTALAAIAIVLAVALGTASDALAHHSAAMFDFTKSAEVEGVVKDIRVINPHMSLVLVVTDAKGAHEISFEGHSVNNFYRAGWRPDSVKVGDKIKVRFAPRKDGHDGAGQGDRLPAAWRHGRGPCRTNHQ